MKIRLYTILMLLCIYIANLQAQDYLISFAGSGASTTVTTVKVENLTQDITLPMSGSNILHLMGSISGIEPGESEKLMQYNTGDRLKFTGMSDIYSTVITDVPSASKTITFNFIACTDGDFNNYPTVKIGNQVWMAENLKTTKFNDGSIIPLVTSNTQWGSLTTPAYCWYNNEIVNKDIYGALYNWYSTATSKLCPIDWHLPTDAEWTTLENYMIANGYNYDGTTTGNKIAKSLGSDYGWVFTTVTGAIGNTDYPSKRNASGFTALPGGYRSYEGVFGSIFAMTNWWSATQYNVSDAWAAWARRIQNTNINLYRVGYYIDFGASIRCLNNNGLLMPTVTSNSVTNITNATATSGGNVTSGGGATVISRGVCWSTSPNPTIVNSKTVDGNGTGTFTSNITGLAANTFYYVRAYATNGMGTAYGDELSFKTITTVPVILSTNPATNITSTTATSGGSVTNDGGATITSRGVCWSTSPNPTIVNSKTVDGAGTGSFNSTLTGLTSNFTYYVRAYATNSVGTGYGNQISFTTLQGAIIFNPGITYGSLTDIDGNNYKTLEIGTQIWMAENLKTTKFNDGTIIPLVTDGTQWSNLTTPGYCWYNNDINNKSIYGAMYNWQSAATGKLCPVGWRVPSDAEWHQMVLFVDPTAVYELNESLITGGKLKEIGLTHWLSPNEGATNEIGFTGLPAGQRQSGGTFERIGGVGTWWMSNDFISSNAWYRSLGYSISYVYRNHGDKKYGFSIRCLKDIPPPFLNVSATSISLGSGSGSVSSFAISSNTSWNISDDADWLNVSPISGSDNGTINITATSENAGTIPRTAKITITGTGVVNKIVTVIQVQSALKIIGNTDVYSLTSTSPERRAQTITLTEAGTIQSISIYHNGGTGQVLLGVYADASGAPGARLGVTPSTTINSTAGWQTVSLINSVAVTSGQKLWLSWVFENNPGVRYIEGIPARAQSTDTWSGGIPDPFGTATFFNYKYSLYCTYTTIANPVIKTMGNTEVYNLSTATANRRALPVTFTEAGTIQSISIYHNGGTGKVLLGVYADASGLPASRLGVTPATAINSTAGWQTISLISPVAVTPGQQVWLSWVFENNPGVRYIEGIPARAESPDTWSGGMPDSFGTATYANYKYSLYSTYIISGGGTPTITTTEITSLTKTSAQGGGNIISDGGSNVTARGVCWSTSPNPTVGLSTKTTDGSGTGTFTSAVTGLSAGTIYYLRAYATNNVGTAYGNEISFKTYNPDAVLDIDGNFYNIVSIGTQTWIAENLKTTKYKDGTTIPLITDNTTWAALETPGYCWQNNDADSYKLIYGALYNWHTVNTDKLCPEGWHVPSDAEWTVLTSYLGGEGIAGGKLKEIGTSHWISPNTGATNEKDFTALPGGLRSSAGVFNYIGKSGTWWSSTEYGSSYAWFRSMYNTSITVGRNSNYLKKNGFSVRCIKDVATLNVSPTSISLGYSSGSTGTFNITSNTAWTIEDDAAWLSVAPVSGTNNATITVTATSANTGTTSRTATVTITGTGVPNKTITVTQDRQTNTKTLGNTEVYSLSSATANRRALPITFTEEGTIQSITIYHNGGTGRVLLGVYADQTNSPGGRLGVTPETVINTSAGWQTITLTSPVTVTSGQKIWLSWVFENNPGVRYVTGTPARAQSATVWSGGMPNPFGAATYANYKYSVYCTYEPGGTGPVTKTLGNTEVYSLSSTTANRRALPVTFTEEGTIQSISIYHNGGTGKVLLGLFADASGAPAARLGITPETVINSSAGWQTVSLNSPVSVTSGQKVWLSWVFENNPGVRYVSGTPARAQSTAVWSGGMPDPFGAATFGNYKYSIYCTYTTGTAPSTKTLGNTEVYGLSSTTANRRALPITFTEEGTIQSITIYHNGGTGKVLLAVYEDQSGAPATRLAVTAEAIINSTAGWQTIPLAGTYSVSSGQKVWLAWVFENNPGVRYIAGTPSRAQSTAIWSGGMPDPFGVATFANYKYSIYCTYTTSSGDEIKLVNEPLEVNSIYIDKEEVLIYPNPTDGEITVTWKNRHSNRLDITIYNILGKAVKEIQTDPDVNEIRLDLDGTSRGIYLFEMKDKKNNLILNRSRIIKK